MTRVYWADVSPLCDDVIFEACKQRLPQQRLQKLNKLKYRKDKNLSVASWLVLSEALEGFPHYNGDENIIIRQNGKAVFADNPYVHFNISHSGDVAMCAVSDSPVGVDVQLVCDFKEAICRRYFCPGEADCVLKEPDPCKRQSKFFDIWTLKEAYAKMTGGGLGEFRKFSINISCGIHIKSNEIMGVITFRQFDIPGYKAAVCIGAPEVDFEFKRVNIIKMLIN